MLYPKKNWLVAQNTVICMYHIYNDKNQLA